MNKRLHYAWVILAACFLLMADQGLQLSLVTVFLKPVSESLGISRTLVSVCQLVAGVSGMISSTQAGKIYRRFTMRRTMVFAVFLNAFGLFCYSSARAAWQLFLSAVLYGFGNALTGMIPVSILLNNWFHEKRGMASSLAFVGSSVGNLFFIQVATRLLLTLDWRTVYRILAVSKLCMILTAALFMIVYSPEQRSLTPYGWRENEAAVAEERPPAVTGISAHAFVKTSVFYCLLFSAGISGVYYLGVQSHLQSFLTDIGLPIILAANVMSLLLVVQIVGKLLLGMVLDRFGIPFSILCELGFYLAGIVCLLFTPAVPMLAFPAAVALGAASGQVTIFPPYITSHLVGRRDYPAIIGLVQVAYTLGNNLNTMATSLIYDLSGGYAFAWILYMVLAVLGAVSYFYALRKGRGFNAL